VLNKVDLPTTKAKLKTLQSTFARRKVKLLALSAATGEGIGEVLEAAWRALVRAKKDDKVDAR